MKKYNKYLNYYIDIQILKSISDKWCQNIHVYIKKCSDQISK